MAIIVEEPKAPRNWGSIIAIVVIVLILFGGVYFLFFQRPVLIELATPLPLQENEQLSKLNFNPAGIENSEVFKALRQYSPAPTAGNLGRTNPFLAF